LVGLLKNIYKDKHQTYNFMLPTEFLPKLPFSPLYTCLGVLIALFRSKE
jgi:hypothetical protein